MRVWELSKHARDFALDLILMWLVLLLWGLALPVAGLAGLFLWIWLTTSAPATYRDPPYV